QAAAPGAPTSPPHQLDAALWSRSAAAADIGPYLQAWLALQCAELECAVAGVVLWQQDGGAFAPMAVWPSVQRDVTHLSEAARRALLERRGLTSAGGDAVSPRAFVAYPIVVGDVARAVAVVDLLTPTQPQLQRAMQRLHWGAGWLESRARDDVAARAPAELAHVRAAVDLVAVAADAATAREAMLALVNGVVDKLAITRAMLGVARRGRVELWAISKTAWFDGRTQEAGEIENLMEEALDQGAALRWPVTQGEAFKVRVAHEEWCRRRSTTAVASVPVVGRDGAVAVLTVERDDGAGIHPADVQRLQALCLLLGPQLQDKLVLERWLAGRVPRQLGVLRERVLGQGHATWKLGTVALIAVALVLGLATQDYRVTAKSVIQGLVQRAAVAPFDGFVASAPVRAGQVVKAGQVLATLDDRDLRLEATRWQSEFEQADQKQRDATAKRDRAAMAMLSAQMRQAQSQRALAEQKLARTEITAAIDGLVVSGDLSQKLGSPVQTGELLFEVARLDGYRVILQVDERDIGELRVGQSGRLVLNGWSREALAFKVTNVTAVAEQREGRNYFRVESALAPGSHVDLRPGMEGVAKVEVGERKLWWVWTHTLADWLRLATWRWLP
ncbi:MAG: HlyD family efflux transporter periplasmic adaptor subunit, partial [Caulobacter sp.]|nr:HlyD family efflux transporter periplasmic adaptor subunit [Vitreoscilla sp.]